MALCNFCNRKETRIRPFTPAFTCFDCSNDSDNYIDTNDENVNREGIIFINNEGKNVTINQSTELCIIEETDDASKNIPTQDINTNDFKDNLLASMYSQLEFLKQVIVKKDHQLKELSHHIRALLLREANVYDVPRQSKNNINYSSTTTSTVNNISQSSEDSFELIDDINEFEDSDNVLDDSFQVLQFQIMEEERKKEIANNIATQLAEIRSMKHDEYLNMKKIDVDEVDNTMYNLIDRGLNSITETKNVPYFKSSEIEHLHADDTQERNEVKAWQSGTCLIMGSSLLNGVKEELVGPRFKVRAFPGAIIQDFYDYAMPLVKKKPSSIILMAGSNDAVNKNKSSQSLLEELLRLKSFLQSKFMCDVILSCPTYRFDDQKANVTLRNLRNNLLSLEIPVISNANITDIHIWKKGLHLNERGSGRLAMNYLSYMRKH